MATVVVALLIGVMPRLMGAMMLAGLFVFRIAGAVFELEATSRIIRQLSIERM